MKTRTAVLYSAIVAVGWAVAFAQSGVPALINFQGRLTDANGNALNGAHSFAFAIFDAATDGTQLWSETQSNVTVSNGVYAVQLGSVNPWSLSLFSSSSTFLQVSVDGTTLSPRERFTASPYAAMAGALRIPAGAAAGKVLTSDAAGNASWQAAAAGGMPSGTTAGDLLYWSGSQWAIVPVGQPGQTLQIGLNSLPTWTGTPTTVITYAASGITDISATSGGTVDASLAVSARGVCWAVTPNPTIANSRTIDGSGTGAFTSSITGLTANTLYYVRAYATTAAGTTYGNQVTFTTLAVAITHGSQTFNVSGTWTRPAGVTTVWVTALGGGGGGGGSDDNCCGGGGGGAGEAIIESTVTVSGDVAVVVGLGGGGGVGQTSCCDGRPAGAGTTPGGDGANSTFGGTLVVARGGKGGLNPPLGTGGASGGGVAGGSAAGGACTGNATSNTGGSGGGPTVCGGGTGGACSPFTGGAGSSFCNSGGSPSGGGGASIFGSGGIANNQSNGSPGGTGAGGGAGGSGWSNPCDGGAGGNGRVIVRW